MLELKFCLGWEGCEVSYVIFNKWTVKYIYIFKNMDIILMNKNESTSLRKDIRRYI